ncbi:MAG: hypothetical protein NC132_05535 [Corallococcus sp.]|nr:hypothetical protein [Corallococcus sp.]MCM1359998.1 hypothetical protein [Corallococcus sp.]MCM1395555.1 hypothetical protein [Corallococcus sp.]
MLNAMFKEFSVILGDEYGLFREFAPQPWKNAKLCQKYKNLGVLYINNGNLNKLPDGALMEISYTLELFMRVDASVADSAPVVLPLEKLATGTTGTIRPQNGSSGGTQYVLDTGLPQSDGELLPGNGCFYVRYRLPVSAVFTNGVALSDNNNITITIDGKDYALKSVISFTEAPQTQLETNTFINSATASGSTFPAMQNESFVVASGWSAQINKLYRPDQEGDVQLRRLLLDTPKKELTLTYSIDSGEGARKRQVIAHDAVFSNELGQASYMTVNFSSAMR